jgi:peptidoglycan/xylan/chitin deacetylase (PgdA/CDA1 family)
MLETVERWRDFPALERSPSGVALTFDDGPDPDSTPAVLDALDAAGARATFFVLGEQLMHHHAIARETLARGHELGLHGFGHERHTDMPGRSAADDMARGVGTFEAAVGRRPRFYRPPYGFFNEASYGACADLGLEPVYWSAWGLDWMDIGADQIADLVLRDLDAGTIVLLHDSPRWAPRDSARATAEAIPLIAAGAAERGLEWTTLGAGLAPAA